VTHDRRNANIVEIEVTPEMVVAGLAELREHHFGEDLSYMVECIYRVMASERRPASESKPAFVGWRTDEHGQVSPA
jgi:hypothetical protein